jgi:hypothetical protein
VAYRYLACRYLAVDRWNLSGWALVRDTFDWGVLDEKRTHPNTNIERSKWDFGPASVILCHNYVGALAYVETKSVLKVKLLSVPKRTCARYEQ